MNADVVVPIVLIPAVLPLAIGILVIRDRYKAWRGRKSPQQLEAERQDLIQRLRHPEWPAIERALGRRVPNVLKALYADSQWPTFSAGLANRSSRPKLLTKLNPCYSALIRDEEIRVIPSSSVTRRPVPIRAENPRLFVSGAQLT
jgi:hypothetical protein